MYNCFVYNNGYCYLQRSFARLRDAKLYMDGLCGDDLKGKSRTIRKEFGNGTIKSKEI